MTNCILHGFVRCKPMHALDIHLQQTPHVKICMCMDMACRC